MSSKSQTTEHARITRERGVLLGTIVGLNVLALILMLASVWNQNPAAPQVIGSGMALTLVVGVGALAAVLLLAAIGFAAPVVALDLFAAWLMLQVGGGIAVATSVICCLAAGAGLAHQIVTVQDWRLAGGSWARRIAIGIGAVALVGAVAFGGLALAVSWAFGDKVHPEYLENLRADPMAAYADAGLELVDERVTEAADTWKQFRSAQIWRRFAFEPSRDPNDAVEDAVQAAETHGWARTEATHSDRIRLSKDRQSLEIALLDLEGRTYLTLEMEAP